MAGLSEFDISCLVVAVVAHRRSRKGGLGLRGENTKKKRSKQHIRQACTLHGRLFTDMLAAVHAVPPLAPLTRILYVEFNVPPPQLLVHVAFIVMALQLIASNRQSMIIQMRHIRPLRHFCILCNEVGQADLWLAA